MRAIDKQLSASSTLFSGKLLAHNVIHLFQEFLGGIRRNGRACSDVMTSAHAAHGARRARQCICQVQAGSDQILRPPGRYFELAFRSSGKGQDGHGAICHLEAHAGHDSYDCVKNCVSCIEVLDALQRRDSFLADKLQAVDQILAVLAEQRMRFIEGLLPSPMQT